MAILKVVFRQTADVQRPVRCIALLYDIIEISKNRKITKNTYQSVQQQAGMTYQELIVKVYNAQIKRQ